MDEQTKYKVYSLVHQGIAPQQIADDIGVGISTVLRHKREFTQAKENGDLDKLLNVDRMLVAQAAEDLDVIEHGEQLIKGLNGLDTLSDELQKTALQINTRVRSLVMSCEHASELESLTSIICDLQVAFLNKNQTQVNVQNNFSNDQKPKYTQFMSDAPGS